MSEGFACPNCRKVEAVAQGLLRHWYNEHLEELSPEVYAEARSLSRWLCPWCGAYVMPINKRYWVDELYKGHYPCPKYLLALIAGKVDLVGLAKAIERGRDRLAVLETRRIARNARRRQRYREKKERRNAMS